MLSELRRLAVLSCVTLLSACTLNTAHPIDGPPLWRDNSRAIVIFGVGIEERWPYQGFSLILDEFSPADGRITGDCFFYNRLEAKTDATPHAVRYFVFSAPAGAYVISPNARYGFRDGQERRFDVRAGAVNYLGDFVLVGRRQLELRDAKPAADAFARRLKLPATSVAKAVPIDGRGPGFLCTP